MKITTDDIVISGIGGYFPKAKNIEEFQKCLLNNDNLITSRWSEGLDGVNNAIGAIDSGYFDHGYFRILRQQCPYLDPMYCMAYERAYEALLDAGVNPVELKGKDIGCFLGSCIGESDNILTEVSSNGYGITGHSRAMLPSRISYWLDIKGPSFNVFCNWLSGLEVLRIAKESIEKGHCEAAIVGATNLTVNSAFQWAFNDIGMISPDGTHRCFDADANGMVRSDGVVMLYLQRARDAKRSYATVVKVQSTFDGCRPGPLLDIDVDNYSRFLTDFYKDTPVKPNEVEYVEAYGCGMKKIDQKEIEALEKVYCKNRKDPLLIGCEKSNTGHAEATSVLFGLVKVIIAMETETIPATINHKNPNPNIAAFKNGTIELVSENRKWSGEYAAVNGLGLDSYYGHILLKSNSKKKKLVDDGIPKLVLAASRTETGIAQMIETIQNQPNIDVEYINLIHEFYSKPTPLHTCRGYVLRGENEIRKETQIYQGNKSKIWFVYSGMGSQWAGMVGDLMKISVFADSINRSHDILTRKGLNLKEVIQSKDPKTFDNILNCFIGIGAIQIALTDVLTALGIVPDGIIGHSLGELGCAYADGCLTAEEVILATYYRGRASIEANLIKGMMAAVGLGYNKIKDMLPPNVEVACHNGPDSCTISGPTEDMEQFVKKLQNDGIFARLVNVANIAYHSRYIKPAAPILMKYLSQLLPTPVRRSSKWITTSNKEENWDTDLAKFSSAEYHTNNLLNPVFFEEGFRHVPKDSILIEIAPHGLLQAILKRSSKPGCVNVPLTQRGVAKNVEFLLVSLGKLYLSGLNINLGNIYPKIEYPVSKGTPSLASLAHWDHIYWENAYGESSSIAAVADLQGTLNSAEFRNCTNHQLNNEIVIPTSSFLKIILDVLYKIKTGYQGVIFEDLTFTESVIISEFSSIPIHVMIQRASGNFEVLAGTKLIVTGRLKFPIAGEKYLIDPVSIPGIKNVTQVSKDDIYNEFKHRGHQYENSYKKIQHLALNNQGSKSLVSCDSDWTSLLEAMIQQKLFFAGEQTQQVFVPKSIDRIAIDLSALPSEPTQLTVEHHYSSNVISTTGINIIGLKSSQLVAKNRNIAIDSVEFIPLEGSKFDNIDTGLCWILQTILDNFQDKNLSHVEIQELTSANPSLLSNINNILKYFNNHDFKVSTVQSPNSITFKTNVPQLVVYNSELTDNLANICTKSSGFLLVRSNPNIKNYTNIIELLQFTVNDLSYSLLRQVNNSKPIIVNVKENILSINDITNTNIDWVQDLEKAIVFAKKQLSKVYLVSNILPVEGIKAFAKKITSLQKMEIVHLLFIVNSPQINSITPKLFQKDLRINVINNNVLGTVALIPLLLKKLVINHENRTDDININYIGLNNDATFLNRYDSSEIVNSDYSGIDKLGRPIMGLASFDRNTSKLSVDPILSWEIPTNLALEDATTIPLAYTSAYYYLIVKGKLKPGERVLIHLGHTPVGLAAIAIATSLNCIIFTTVETEAQKTYLKNRYQLLKDHNIFINTTNNFEPMLSEKTFGLKANVVLNTLNDKYIEGSVGCLGLCGRLIHIGENKLNTSIGMHVFKQSASFASFNPNNISKLSSEGKKLIKSLVDEGLRNNVVRTTELEILDNIDIQKIRNDNSKIGKSCLIEFNGNKQLNKMLSPKSIKFVCNPDAIYLVYGGNSDDWCNLVEWFVYRGARKVVIAVKFRPNIGYINRRINILQRDNNVNIDFVPLQAETINGAQDLIINIKRLAQIDIICVLPQQITHAKHIKTVLEELSPTTKLVTFDKLDISTSGTFNIKWENDLTIRDAIQCLDNVLNYNIGNCLIQNTVVSAQKDKISAATKLNLLLPTVNELLEDINTAPEKPQLLQLASAGPREIRELPPFIIIPGLNTRERINALSLNLIYPIWAVVLPKTVMTFKELAQDIAKQIKKVYPDGVYNLIGTSWGGPLMVEIANILNEEGASLHLYFIDSAPDTIKSVVDHLGETESEIEANLLTKIFQIENFEQRNAVVDMTTWDDKINVALKNFNGSIEEIAEIKQALNNLKQRLYSVKDFKYLSEKLIRGRIHLIRPKDSSEFDSCGLTSYCQQVPVITVVNGDHLSIINDPQTVHYISSTHYVI